MDEIDLIEGERYRFVKDTHDLYVGFRPGTIVTFHGYDADGDPDFSGEGYGFRQMINPSDIKPYTAAAVPTASLYIEKLDGVRSLVRALGDLDEGGEDQQRQVLDYLAPSVIELARLAQLCVNNRKA